MTDEGFDTVIQGTQHTLIKCARNLALDCHWCLNSLLHVMLAKHSAELLLHRCVNYFCVYDAMRKYAILGDSWMVDTNEHYLVELFVL